MCEMNGVDSAERLLSQVLVFEGEEVAASVSVLDLGRI
jgi:hypothetical protein